MKKKMLITGLILIVIFSLTACSENKQATQSTEELEIGELKTNYSDLTEFINSISWDYTESDLVSAGYTESAFPEEDYDSEYFNQKIVIETLNDADSPCLTVYFKYKNDVLENVELYYSPQDKSNYIEKFDAIYNELNETQNFEKHLFFVRENENDEGSYSELDESDSVSETNLNLADAIDIYYTGYLYKLYFSSDEHRYETSTLTGSSSVLPNEQGIGFSISYDLSNTETSTDSSTSSSENIDEDITESDEDSEIAEDTPSDEAPEEQQQSSDTASLEEANALSKALDYLSYTPFSRSGLIKQLEYEEYSSEAATYAVDNCGANWKEQALNKAIEYLGYSAFSYSGLIKQLEYEGFTKKQAKFGAKNCDADWKEQAAQKAQEYMDYSSFSRSGLIDQLKYEGFTQEQAEYGASAVGY